MLDLQRFQTWQLGHVISASLNLTRMSKGAKAAIVHITSVGAGLTCVFEGTMEDLHDQDVTEATADWYPLGSLTVNTSSITRNLPGATLTPTDDDVLIADLMGCKFWRLRRASNSGTANSALSDSHAEEIAKASLNVVADTELTTRDADSGAGTDTVAVVGVVLEKSGGGVLLKAGQQTAANSISIVTNSEAPITVNGPTGHGSTYNLNPLGVGFQAIAHGANPTAADAAALTKAYANRHGIPFVIGGHMNAITLGGRITDANGAQTDLALVTVSSGTKIVVTAVDMTPDGSNTGPINGIIGFGAANVPTPDENGAAGIVFVCDGMAAGGGKARGNGGGILGVGADGEDLRLTCEDPAGGALTWNVTYYTIES